MMLCIHENHNLNNTNNTNNTKLIFSLLLSFLSIPNNNSKGHTMYLENFRNHGNKKSLLNVRTSKWMKMKRMMWMNLQMIAIQLSRFFVHKYNNKIYHHL